MADSWNVQQIDVYDERKGTFSVPDMKKETRFEGVILVTRNITNIQDIKSCSLESSYPYKHIAPLFRLEEWNLMLPSSGCLP